MKVNFQNVRHGNFFFLLFSGRNPCTLWIGGKVALIASMDVYLFADIIVIVMHRFVSIQQVFTLTSAARNCGQEMHESFEANIDLYSP
jgi:hypothetical protein